MFFDFPLCFCWFSLVFLIFQVLKIETDCALVYMFDESEMNFVVSCPLQRNKLKYLIENFGSQQMWRWNNIQRENYYYYECC